MSDTETRARKISSQISLVVALVLVVAKLGAWLATDSVALLASALDAVVDTAASLVTFLGVRYAERPADAHHRFGHGKGEAVAGLLQATFLAGAALCLIFQSAERLISPVPLSSVDIGVGVITGSLFCALLLVGVQSWALRKHHSTAIAADKAHYVTDVAVNGAVLAGLAVTKFTGWERADPVFAMIVSAYMLWNVRSIAREALAQLLDRELSDKDRERITRAVLACPQVGNMHDLRTRHAGDRSFVEFHLEVDGTLSVKEGHAIGDLAEAAAASVLTGLVEVTCHLEPLGIDDERLDNRVRDGKQG